MLPKLRRKRKIAKIIRLYFNFHLEKKADLFKEVCFRELPVSFKSEFDWHGKIIPKGCNGIIRVVDPAESALLIDVQLPDAYIRITEYVEDILEHLDFKDKEDRKYLKEVIENTPWTSVIYG